MPSIRWEDRWMKLSPKMEMVLESMVQQREAAHGGKNEEQRETYKATLRYLVSQTLTYDE